MSDRNNKDVAYRALNKIREYWSTPENARRFFAPIISVRATTHVLISDMKNGYPPRIKSRAV